MAGKPDATACSDVRMERPKQMLVTVAASMGVVIVLGDGDK